jgi:hypothetical protein
MKGRHGAEPDNRRKHKCSNNQFTFTSNQLSPWECTHGLMPWIWAGSVWGAVHLRSDSAECCEKVLPSVTMHLSVPLHLWRVARFVHQLALERGWCQFDFLLFMHLHLASADRANIHKKRVIKFSSNFCKRY